MKLTGGNSITGAQIITGDLTVQGNITQSGNVYTTHMDNRFSARMISLFCAMEILEDWRLVLYRV